jgi:hypothetical protein
MLDASRVQKELVEFERDKSLSGVSIQIYDDDLTRMRGTISGPVGTPYEGGIFTVDIQLPCKILLPCFFLFTFSSKVASLGFYDCIQRCLFPQQSLLRTLGRWFQDTICTVVVKEVRSTAVRVNWPVDI